MDSLTFRDIKAVVGAMANLMNENKQLLIELDAAMGDGDLGLTMTTGFARAVQTLNGLEDQDIGRLLGKAGVAIAQAAPSTMGTLIASGFMRAGKAVQGRDSIDLQGLAEMFDAFVEGIMARGKAKPGDKTIIDSLHPAAEALKASAALKKSLPEGLASAYEAALKGVEETKNMISQHGRAAYYQEKSIGKQDPGATVGMLMVRAFAEYVNTL